METLRERINKLKYRVTEWLLYKGFLREMRVVWDNMKLSEVHAFGFSPLRRYKETKEAKKCGKRL